MEQSILALANTVVSLDEFKRDRLRSSPALTQDLRLIQPQRSPSILDIDDETKAITELYNIFEECNEVGWDGYHAERISVASVNGALDFVTCAIRSGYPLPDFVPDPSGKVGMVWRNEGLELIVTVNLERNLIFSVLDANRKGTFYGSVEYNDSIPPEVGLFLMRLRNVRDRRTS